MEKWKRSKALLVLGLFAPILAGWSIAWGGSADKSNLPFPSFGAGKVEVRLYSDYFCPPCQQTEPHLEPILQDLLMRNVIRLILIDFPGHSQSALYSRYFLYAMKSGSSPLHALRVRRVLFGAAAKSDALTAQKIEDLFRKEKIPYAAFDPKPVFDRLNALIKEDHANRTPMCVIITSGKKKDWTGGMDIYNALNALR